MLRPPKRRKKPTKKSTRTTGVDPSRFNKKFTKKSARKPIKKSTPSSNMFFASLATEVRRRQVQAGEPPTLTLQQLIDELEQLRSTVHLIARGLDSLTAHLYLTGVEGVDPVIDPEDDIPF